MTEDAGSGAAARLIPRGALGSTTLAHGVRHARSLDSTAGWFAAIGLRRPSARSAMFWPAPTP